MKNTQSYKIQKCRSTDDFDNMCLQPSDGGVYTLTDALRILENGNGGAIIEQPSGKGFLVSYDSKKNNWLREKIQK